MTEDVGRLISELFGMMDRNDRAIIKKLDEIQAPLADIQERVEANMREGEPEEEDC